MTCIVFNITHGVLCIKSKVVALVWRLSSQFHRRIRPQTSCLSTLHPAVWVWGSSDWGGGWYHWTTDAGGKKNQQQQQQQKSLIMMLLYCIYWQMFFCESAATSDSRCIIEKCLETGRIVVVVGLKCITLKNNNVCNALMPFRYEDVRHGLIQYDFNNKTV